MKYSKLEKKKAMQDAIDNEQYQLAKMYYESNSIEEFKIKVDLSDFSKSKLIKWFILYYHITNLSLFRFLPMIIGIISFVLCFIQLIIVTIAIKFAFSFIGCSENTIFLIFLVYSTISVALSFLMTDKICSKFCDIKNKIEFF